MELRDTQDINMLNYLDIQEKTLNILNSILTLNGLGISVEIDNTPSITIGYVFKEKKLVFNPKSFFEYFEDLFNKDSRFKREFLEDYICYICTHEIGHHIEDMKFHSRKNQLNYYDKIILDNIDRETFCKFNMSLKLRQEINAWNFAIQLKTPKPINLHNFNLIYLSCIEGYLDSVEKFYLEYYDVLKRRMQNKKNTN